MPSLTGMTLAQMRAATVVQLRTAVNNRINAATKAQIIRLELYVRNWDIDREVRIPDADTRTDWPDGQIKSRQTVTRDVPGAKTGTVRHEWTYYSPEGAATQGPVDTITRIELDASDAEIGRKTIKHFADGRQPVVT